MELPHNQHSMCTCVSSEMTPHDYKHDKRTIRGTYRSWIPPRTKYRLIIPLLLQFLLTFAQGQGQGPMKRAVEEGMSPSVHQRVNIPIEKRAIEEGDSPSVRQRVNMEIEEEMPVGTVVGRVPVQLGLQYRFSEEPEEFSLDAMSGNVSTSTVIDREALRESVFNLVVQSVPSTKHLIEVIIEVLDVNDNSPSFPHPVIQVEFSEADQQGRQVIIDTATDPDTTKNGIKTYKIVGGNQQNRFKLIQMLEGSKPIIYLENQVVLDREDVANYKLNISAEDYGSRKGYMTANISIKDVNDHGPIFDQSDYFAVVNETAPPGTTVSQVQATDGDTGLNGEVTYHIDPQSDQLDQLHINTQTGVITTTKMLSCSHSCDVSAEGCDPNSCVIQLTARDRGVDHQRSGRAYLTISLLDENNHSPVIDYQFKGGKDYAEIEENANVGQTVALIFMSDDDHGANAETKLKIIKGNTKKHFKLSEESVKFDKYTRVELLVASLLDREEIAMYNLTLEASDQGDPRRVTVSNMLIIVNDVNDHHPEFERKSYHSDLSEFSPVGSFVAALTALDNDTGINAEISYFITSGNDRDWFTINKDTGLITTKSHLDRETSARVVLVVKAQDGNSKPQTTTVQLEVVIWDENEAPDLSSSHIQLSISEGVGADTRLTRVSAIDNDSGPNGTVTYRLTPESMARYTDMFTIGLYNGEVTFQRSLDREEYDHIELTVTATDGGQPPLTSIQVIEVNVTDVNDNDPVLYPTLYHVHMMEGEASSTNVVQVTGHDEDIGQHGRVVYSIDNGGDNFAIDDVTGWISTTRQMDGTQRGKHVITVSGADGGGRLTSHTATVMVIVTNMETLPLAFTESAYQMTTVEDTGGEDSYQERTVGRVEAVPADQVAYHIVSGDPSGRFTIHSQTGVITTSSHIDREQTPYHELVIVAERLTSFAEVTVNVTVDDLNDNSPWYELDEVYALLDENSPYGYEVYLAAARDEDNGVNGTLTYTLTQPNPLFSIDSDTGMIRLSRPGALSLDTSHQVVIRAVDGGGLSSQVTLYITIRDVNDHTPLFEQASYEASIDENFKVNDHFVTVLANDADLAENGRVTYSIVKGNSEYIFGIFPDGVMYVANKLDRETTDLYLLTIKACDLGFEPRCSLANVSIHVMDTNDNAPIFSNKTYTMRIVEGMDVGTYVGSVYAIDYDIGSNAELLFAIAGVSNEFTIHPKSGAIKNTKVFDREELLDSTKADYISLEVIVKDSGTPQLQSKAQVKVIINDINDNPPVFTKDIYEAALFENADIDTSVAQVTAIDSDHGVNADISYTIIEANHWEVFQMNESTGQVLLRKPLDREAVDEYNLLIMAMDRGSPPYNTTTELHIDVWDTNDNKPAFRNVQQPITVPETTIKDHVITQLIALDNDLGNNAAVRYHIVDGNRDVTFKIDNKNGKVKLASSLDYESVQSYTLNVTATDSGSPPLMTSMLLVVQVEDVNDNTPRFSGSTIVREIREGVSNGTSVGTVIATDADSRANGEVRYHIKSQEPPGDHFMIDSRSGLIRTRGEIDREFTDNYKLTVQAVDQALPVETRRSAEKLVSVFITDVNDNAPIFISMNAVPVSITHPSNTSFTRIRTYDPDDGLKGQVKYQITADQIFGVREETGDLFLHSPFVGGGLFYDITVKAQDQGMADSEGQKSALFQLTVFVTSEGDGPTFTQTGYSGQVTENMAEDTSVATVSAYDPQGDVEYYLTGITSDGQLQPRYFKVHHSSGIIRTTMELDRENGFSMFTLEIYAVNKVAPTPRVKSVQVQVTLLDQNDSPPVFTQSVYEAQVAENVNPGHVVDVMIKAEDPDQEGTVTYRLKDTYDNRFLLQPATGQLEVLSGLDRESRANYDLDVIAHDGVQSAEVTVKVRVTDVNDQSPLFTKPWYTFNVQEDALTELLIGQIHATDADIGDNAVITYSLVSHLGRDKFSLHPQTGVFTLIGKLDYEDKPHYVLRVRAQDRGALSLSSTATVYINILDVNDNAPIYDPSTYSRQVWENETVGTSILQVTATDSDTGVNSDLEYSIVRGDKSGRFSVDAVSGVVSVVASLDRETQAVYQLHIQATDLTTPQQDRLSSTALVTVVLRDVNDEFPVFVSPRVVSFPENEAAGSPVTTLVAEDPDEGVNSEVRYHLDTPPEDTPTDLFTLGEQDGVLRCTRMLDREVVDSYSLVVRAVDRGTPAKSTIMSLTVQVADKNDNSPTFDSESTPITIPENTKVGTSLLSVHATDQDHGFNADIRYMIEESQDAWDFRVDPYNGALSIEKPLDYEQKVSYEIRVVAQDLGSPPRSDVTVVQVMVEDVNDSPPVFVDSPYVAYVQENTLTSPVHVMNIAAQDADSDVYARLSYYLIHGDATSSIFKLNTSSEETSIWAHKPLDREKQHQYQVLIRATDSGNPRLTGTGTVIVQVKDENDNVPIFHHRHYLGRVSEDASFHSSILQVRATDADTDKNAEISYTLTQNPGDKFGLDESSGWIYTADSLDREEAGEYELVVMATDRGSMPLSSSVSVTVYLDDVNDNTPAFEANSYSATVRDPTGSGSFVLGVTAVDQDVGDNGVVEYSLKPGGHAAYFTVDPDTGVITASRDLQRSMGNTLQITVIATDKGGDSRSSEASVEVTFLPSSSSGFPVIQERFHTVSVSESRTPGHVVYTLTASSPSGADLSYHMMGGNIGSSFDIDDSGRVKLSGLLDYEKTTDYNLWLGVRDNRSPPLSDHMRLTVTVTDENDNPPFFEETHYTATVEEEVFDQQMVVMATATDADSGANGRINYSFREDVSGFEVNSQTGRIQTVTKLDRETISSYSLVVLARDNGEPQYTATATIDVLVLDKNDQPPVFTQHFISKIHENLPVGSFVLRITSSDRDFGPNAVHSYSLPSNPGNRFAIDSKSGNVTVNGLLDRETKDSYILQVAANDGAYNQQTQLQIDILDVNDNAPDFTSPSYTFSFGEQLDVGSRVGDVTAGDRDAPGPNSEIFYRLTTASEYFELNWESGEITSKMAMVYEPAVSTVNPSWKPNQHKLTVEAVDRGEPPMSRTVDVVISIQPSNKHKPQLTLDSTTVYISEDTDVGHVVFTATASDEDEGENAMISFYLMGGNGTNSFDWNSQTGDLTLEQSLSGRSGWTYTVTLEVQDGGTPPKSTSVTIELVVVKVNLYSPQFSGGSSDFSVQISESTSKGRTIGQVSATDSDTARNGIVHFYIVDGDADGHFAIDENLGRISVAKSVDYEMNPVFRLNIAARDNGLIPRETTRIYTVEVQDENDNPPSFDQTEYTALIEENSGRDAFVFQLTASDADSPPNDQVKYYMIGSDISIDKFTLETETGELLAKEGLDYEERKEYQVLVTAINPGTDFTSSATVNVHVTGVNEYVPEFTKDEYVFTVRESMDVGFSVGSVTAQDVDEGNGGEILYYLIGDSNTKGFSIDEYSGVIVIDSEIDREATSEITLDVMSKNQGIILGDDTTFCQVRVIILDDNDPPHFIYSIYRGHVRENADKGTSVIRVSAVDNDIDEDDRKFTYRILAGNTGDKFTIEEESGVIETNGALDRESVEVYSLTVGAVERGAMPETGTTTVEITLDDVNDNSPYFSPSIPEGDITENRVAYSDTILTLPSVTKDRDLHPNKGPYTYTLLDNTDTFEVNTQTGVVMSKVSLDREQRMEYVVQVQVKDGGDPMKSSTLSFRVLVRDENDMPSHAEDRQVLVFVHGGVFDGGLIADVHPDDPDLVGDYHCTIREGDTSLFSVQQACDLTASARQDMTASTLTIEGNDGVHTSVQYQTFVEFQRVEEDIVEHSVVLVIKDKTPADFLDDDYAQLTVALQDVVKGSQKPLVYNLVVFDNDRLGVVVAVREGNTYMSQSALETLLEREKSSVESSTGLTLLSIYRQPCEDNPCKDGKQCTGSLQAFSDMARFNGSTFSLASLRVEPTVTCTCPCENGGICRSAPGGGYQCSCPDTWTGDKCQNDVDECSMSTRCKNGGTCRNSEGSYQCQCVAGYGGRHCEDDGDACSDKPCQSGKCIANPDETYDCECDFGDWGEHCERSSHGFEPISYQLYNLEMQPYSNEIVLEFSTNSRNALLFYYPVSDEGFLALEVIEGHVRLSFALGDETVRVISGQEVSSDRGQWYRVIAKRQNQIGELLVSSCSSEGAGVCTDCDDQDPSCYATDSTTAGNKLLDNRNKSERDVWLGGVQEIEVVLEYPGQVTTHDFVGCMRRAEVDGKDLFTDNNDDKISSKNVADKCGRGSSEGACRVDTCGSGSTCVDTWNSYQCHCHPDTLGDNCQLEVGESVNFGPDTMVIYKPKESYTRDRQMAQASENARRRRSISSFSFAIQLRTIEEYGTFFYLEANNKYGVLHLSKGFITYNDVGSDYSVSTLSVNDAEWHNISLQITKGKGYIQVDSAANLVEFSANFDPDTEILTGMTVGGVPESGQVAVKTGFSGCVGVILMNGAPLPLSGGMDNFDIEQSGDVGGNCSLPSNDSSSPHTALIVIGAFFAIVLVVIVISILVLLRRRKHKTLKSKQNGIAMKANGSVLNKTDGNRSHQDSGFTENGDLPEDVIIRQHIADELSNRRFNEREIGEGISPSRPDLVAAETGVMGQISLDPGGVDNMAYNEEPPEHYDIDNASSIAPSDLVDVVGYYKQFRSGRKPEPGRPHRPPPGRQHHTPSPSALLGLSRQSPSSSSSQTILHPKQSTPLSHIGPLGMRMGSPAEGALNPLSRASPAGHHGRIHHSPAPNIPLHHNGIASMRSTPLSGISEMYHSNSSTTASEAPHNGLPNGMGRPRSNPQQPISQLGLRSTPVRGLTVDDVNRLNTHRKPSTVSTGDAGSSSSDDPNPNHINRTDFTHADLMDPSSSMIPTAESSSDDDSNDSFTCSEVDYDHDKMRNDIIQSRPYPQLATVNEAGVDTDVSRKSHDASDSFSNQDGSISTFFTSDDELPKGGKLPKSALNWDYLLNWGPNFQKLVGVFSDIAQLPDVRMQQPNISLPPKSDSPAAGSRQSSRQSTPQPTAHTDLTQLPHRFSPHPRSTPSPSLQPPQHHRQLSSPHPQNHQLPSPHSQTTSPILGTPSEEYV